MGAPLRHVLWIGGPSATGKTTIARRIARRHGLRLYSADTQTWVHRDRAIAQGNAAAIRWEALTPRQRWVEARPAEMLEMSLHRERGAMVVDDLRGLPTSPLVVAEGTPLSPSLVSAGIADDARAVWFIPTRGFRRARIADRGPRPSDRLYTELASEIEAEATRHAAPTITVDGSSGVDAVAAAVEDRFSEALAKGPRAESADERRALLRAANDAILAQCRGYLDRPWSTVDPESMMRDFVCECDDPECDELVELRVAGFPASADERVLAPAHG